MAAGLVVGIFPQSDPETLEKALSGAAIDLSKVKVVSSSAEDTEGSALEFVDVIAEVENDSFADDMTHGHGIMSDSGGTGVPGIGGHQATLGSFRSRASATAHYLSAYPIPGDEVANFDDAVANGRSVVLYPDAGADADKVAAAFRSAGLRNVRTY
ncbi:MAG: hypothetical protein JO078_12360 [Candidatus Eremiobacteraeota bacterium]|nr:hypothetical protein [Candidatus Eremiobacteraeota bacterium]MBV9055136.1 hypothetical protein [Candidatus Eremiobacteraeota bacterium]MBV9700894.1 hypothetical protein [Candidatus Eremiobacteraeota bacterium]